MELRNQFMRVEWFHDLPDEPVVLFSELDNDRMEVRKVEVFRDGTMVFASSFQSSGDLELSYVPIPSIAEISKNPQFKPQEISSAEFERIWTLALR